MKGLPGLVALSAAMGISMSASAAEIPVMSGGAPKEVFAVLAPKFEKQTGNTVKFTYLVITAIREKLAAGEKSDVLILPVPVLDGLAKDGKVNKATIATFGNLGISVIVKEGAPKPDISTKEKFKAALLAAKSVVHATPGQTPSGNHMAKVINDLGIADAMARKTIHKPALAGGVQLVSSGEAELGIYPASEVAGVKGISIVGPLPAGTDLTIVYGGGAMSGAAASDAAAAFVKFMAAPENRTVWKEAGFEPPQ